MEPLAGIFNNLDLVVLGMTAVWLLLDMV